MKIFVCTLLFICGFASVDFAMRLSQAAISINDPTIVYDGAYTKIPYPNGDISARKGVCTDVVIRAYRKLGIDLQTKVHQDMAANFSKYPKTWGLKSPDTNIDHRRVPNLQTFFTRKGKSLGISQNPSDYKPGDLVTWLIDEKLPHIGIVTHLRAPGGTRPMIMHNVGGGQVLEDCLFRYKITGRYSYGH